MGVTHPTPITVRGGTHGVDANYDDMVAIARAFGHAAADLLGTSASLHRYLLDPGLWAASLLDPVGAARAEGDLGLALDGPHGVTWLAAECAALDVELRAAAAAYQLADRVAVTLRDDIHMLAELPRAAVQAAGVLAATRNPASAFMKLVADDPDLVDGPMALLDAADVAATNSAESPLLTDGRPAVRARGVDASALATAPPRDLADVVRELALRDFGQHGEIDVRFLWRADGTRAVIVDVPGTKSWNPLPNGDITSVMTDVRAMAGSTTAYELGIFAAMRQAGVTASDPVMFVGHSEGGIVALQAAVDAQASGEFHVTHVITAGAPIGQMTEEVPASINVLAIENAHDVVPHLDGADNAPAPNITTVTIDHDFGWIGPNHDLVKAYLPGAADIDASDDPSVRDFLSSADGFFDASTVRTDRFVITRAY